VRIVTIANINICIDGGCFTFNGRKFCTRDDNCRAESNYYFDSGAFLLDVSRGFIVRRHAFDTMERLLY
jgi:hypothetical protein